MTQVNEVRNEWGYPNSARALSESAVRARAGPGRFGALSAVREEQPEVKPYCACESCACCGSVAVRRGGERAWPGAGQCEGRAGPLPGRVRAGVKGGPSHCLPGACVLRAAGVRGDFGPGPVI